MLQLEMDKSFKSVILLWTFLKGICCEQGMQAACSAVLTLLMTCNLQITFLKGYQVLPMLNDETE